jgi:hypothetical protein
VDESRLLRPEKVSRSTQLKILEGDLVAGAKLSVVLENAEASIRVFIDRIGNEEVAARPTVGASDASAQLVELCQPERIGSIDEHRIGVGNIETGLDDHRRHQYVDLAVDEASHYVLEIALAHLAVSDTDSCARNHMADVLRHPIDGFDSVVNEEHLAPTIELAGNTFVDQSVVPWLDIREHR